MIGVKKLIQNFNFKRDTDTVLNHHEIKASFHNNILETIFANKCIDRMNEMYHELYQGLSSYFGFYQSIIFD